MSTIDENKAQGTNAQAPAKKKKTKSLLVQGLLAVLFLGFLYLYGHHPFFIGSPHIVQIGSTEIVPGKTLVSDLNEFYLSDMGSTNMSIVDNNIQSNYEMISPDAEVEKSSYYPALILVKDNERYGFLDIVNEKASAITVSESKVRSLSIYASDKSWSAENTIDGIAIPDISVESLTAVNGEPANSYESTSEGENITTTTWEKGHYSLELETKADGSVHVIRSNYEKKK